MIGEILKLVSDYGWVSIVAIVAIVIFWKLLVIVLNNKFKNFNILSPSKLNDENELKNHPFFNNAEYRLVVEIPSLEMIPSKPVKQQMFRDIIAIETRALVDMCERITKMDMSNWSEDKWINEISKELTAMLLEFFKKSRLEDIPEIVIMKYNKWHTANIEMLRDYIHVLGNSSVYQTNLARTNTLFLVMNLMLITTIADAERSLKELNGEISGKKYKNMIIES